MTSFAIHPKIVCMSSVADFCRSYKIGAGDLVFVSRRTRQGAFAGLLEEALVVDYRQFGPGEPTDVMAESMWASLQGRTFQRVVAIGGGTILDVAKLFALRRMVPIAALFFGTLPAEKAYPLLLVPTTCGTGSEVTNISILELTKEGTKLGLAQDALYADEAVLIPELLQGMPDQVFAASSIDALIHAMESYTSPKANAFTRMFSLQAMDLILSGYQRMAAEGAAVREALLSDFLRASTLAGIAFGNAGCAAVHAMSYPLGAACHVAHGEANYVLLTAVYKAYQERRYDGSLRALCVHLAQVLDCDEADVFQRLETLLTVILPKKKMREYGVKASDIDEYVQMVITTQTRLMSNNYTVLDTAAIKAVYQSVF